MPNTTTICITCFSNESGIAKFIESTGIDLQQIVEVSKVKRGYVVSMELWAVSVRSGLKSYEIGSEEISVNQIIEAFRSAAFDFPESVCLIIDCDDNEEQSGCYPLVTVGIIH